MKSTIWLQYMFIYIIVGNLSMFRMSQYVEAAGYCIQPLYWCNALVGARALWFVQIMFTFYLHGGF